jgi:uncharacterized protein (TIGR02145 family)
MKQKNKIQLLLVAVLAGLSVMGYAQGKWCVGASEAYQIVQVTAPSDQGATFRWTKNGETVSGATSSLTLPKDLSEGKYEYIRYAKKPDCPDEVASNAFTVEVLTCGDIGDGAKVGAKGTITDARDKKVYKIVKMPDNKVWMAENLNYQAGLTFNARADQAKGEAFTSTNNGVPAIGSFWCPQLNGTAGSVTTSQNTCNVYGALYTWETAMSKDGLGTGSWLETSVEKNYVVSGTAPSESSANVNNAHDNGRGICPAGFRIPTDQEWANLLDAVDAAGAYSTQTGTGWWGNDAGIKIKSASTYVGADPGDGSWQDQIQRGSDLFGFAAVPAGGRGSNGGMFTNRGTVVSYWCSSVISSSTTYYRSFGSSRSTVERNVAYRAGGMSVRCVRN